MTQAGYSDKKLVDKLGYKPLDTIYVFNTPKEFREYLKSEHVIASHGLPAVWAHGFFKSKSELHTFLDSIDLDDIENGLWVSWPKKSSKVKTDLSEQTFRDEILPLGWVDVKVAAINETWSGLKFLRRKNPRN
jgi:hypothetical protein